MIALPGNPRGAGSFQRLQTKVVKSHQGWPSVIGEDIVHLVTDQQRLAYRLEPSAIGFTSAPQTFMGFYRQRKRWARGMIGD